MITCDQCNGACCRSLCVPIAKPKTKTEYEDILWYLYHKNVWIQIDHDGDWFVEFLTECTHLDKETGFCKIYENRPSICRDYKVKDCVRNKPEHKSIFKSPKEYLEFLKEKNIKIPEYNYNANA